MSSLRKSLSVALGVVDEPLDLLAPAAGAALAAAHGTQGRTGTATAGHL